MKLARAASHFNDTLCLDGYTGQVLFPGQFNLFDDTKRDSEPGARRVLSVDPMYTIPARRAIEAQGSHFILGRGVPDEFRGKALRVGYVAHECSEQAQVRTLAQACLTQAGESMWAASFWVKNLAYSDQDSKLPRQIHLHTSGDETLSPGNLASIGGVHYLVRQSTEGTTGIKVTLCDEMPSPAIEAAQVFSGVYDAVADAVTGTSVGVTVVRLRWQSLFEYTWYDTSTFNPGDAQFVIAKSALTVRPGARVTMSDGEWFLSTVQSHDDVWLCQASRHVKA